MEPNSPFGRLPTGADAAQIIGMPEVLAVSATVVIKCPSGCDNILVLSGEVGTMVTCLKCKRNWVIGPLQMARPGQARVAIGEALPKPGQGDQTT